MDKAQDSRPFFLLRTVFGIHRYGTIFHCENALTKQENGGGLESVEIPACGEVLAGPLPAETLTLTAHVGETGRLELTDPQGRCLSIGSNGTLKLTAETSEDNLSAWKLEETNGGWHIVNIESSSNQAIEYIKGKFAAYRLENIGSYLFNFYEVEQ